MRIPRKLQEKDGGHPFVDAERCPYMRGRLGPSSLHGTGVFATRPVRKGGIFDTQVGGKTGFNNLPPAEANAMQVRLKGKSRYLKGFGKAAYVCMLATKDIEPGDEITLRWPRFMGSWRY